MKSGPKYLICNCCYQYVDISLFLRPNRSLKMCDECREHWRMVVSYGRTNNESNPERVAELIAVREKYGDNGLAEYITRTNVRGECEADVLEELDSKTLEGVA